MAIIFFVIVIILCVINLLLIEAIWFKILVLILYSASLIALVLEFV